MPIELDAALSQAGSAVGFLAVLRTFSTYLEGEHAGEALRSLIAPELDVPGFAERAALALEAESDCGSRPPEP